MNHKELMQELQRRSRLDRQQAALLMTSLERILTEEAIATREVAWVGMGRFVSRKHPEYVEQNAVTGETVLYPPRISFRFQADRAQTDAGLTDMLAKRTQMEPNVAAVFLHELAASIMDSLARGDEATINGLGTFSMIDVRQGEARRVAFLPDESMREGVNAPFSCFEPMVIGAQAAMTEDPETPDTPNTPDSQDSPESPEIPDNQDSPESPEVPDTLDTPEPTASIRGRRGWIAAAAVLLVLLIGAAVWLLWPTGKPDAGEKPLAVTSHTSDETHPADGPSTAEPAAGSSTTEPAAEPAPEPAASAAPDPAASTVPDGSAVGTAPTDEQLWKENGVPRREVLGEGQRLTLVALKHYGSKAFWPYIYEVNRHQIKDPNNVSAGVNLYLPDPAYWGIDSTSEQSLNKAKIKAAKLINPQ